MFARTSAMVACSVLALPILAAASAVPRNTPSTIPASSCAATSGSVQCCNSTQDSSQLTSTLIGLLTTLGISASGLTALVGVTCTPITVIGAGGDSCNSQAVCCSNNSFKGVVALGCTPVNLNL